jgi:lysophospholipase L1-like esterase
VSAVRFRSALQNLALTLATLVVLALLLEGGARLVLPEPGPANFTPVPSSLAMPADFSGARFVLRPSASAVHRFPSDPHGYFDPGATLTYRTNALGFRGPETTLEKPPETFRIVGVGDSFTFGTGVRREDTFLAELERRLNERPGGPRFEVLNLGVFAYDTEEEAYLLYYRGMRLGPDLVVLCFFLNDTGGGAEREAFNTGRDRAGQPFWRRHSRLADFVAAGIERRRGVKTLVRAYHRAFEERAPGWVEARRAIHEAKRLTDSRDVPLVMMVFPMLWKLSGDYPFADIHAKVVAFGQSQGIPTLDLLPAFQGHDGPELWVHPANQHPDAEAHRIAGDALYRYLLDNRLVPTGPDATAG